MTSWTILLKLLRHRPTQSWWTGWLIKRIVCKKQVVLSKWVLRARICTYRCCTAKRNSAKYDTKNTEGSEAKRVIKQEKNAFRTSHNTPRLSHRLTVLFTKKISRVIEMTTSSKRFWSMSRGQRVRTRWSTGCQLTWDKCAMPATHRWLVGDIYGIYMVWFPVPLAPEIHQVACLSAAVFVR